MGKKRKRGLAAPAAVILVLVALAVLNPTTADFKAYQAERARAKAGGDLSGTVIGELRKGAGAVAGGVASFFAGAYARRDYLLFSVFQAGDRGSAYLGLAKRVFIKVR